MCGILGQIVFDQHTYLPDQVPSLELLCHRGPDGKGEWFSNDRRAYLGHTRLAILEPTPAGYQPMPDSADRFVITFNGELYNHLFLRALLPNIDWRGTSDTETLIELLASRGPSSLSMLKGMFAFALFDTENQSLFLARDRFGIKPLWVWHNENLFRFSSEIRPLLSGSSIQLSQDALSEYIAFGHMPGSAPNFNGIYSIPPGGWMKVSHTGAIETGMWWPNATDITPAIQSPKKADCAKQVRYLMTQAVEEHLLSDVGVGAFLSGGIDSSIITLIAGQALGKQLKTFTVGFPNSDHDERDIAKKVAILAGSEHHEIEVDEHACLDWVKEAVLSLDIPSVDAINTYIVSKAVQRSGVKVALSGLGGDELFGGYPSFSSVPILRNLRFLPDGLRQLLVNQLPDSYREKLADLTDTSIVNLTVARRRFVSVSKLHSLNLGSGTPAIPFTPPGLDTMGQVSWGEMQGYMIPMILRDSDQMSMAVGLEIRVPFLDHQLVETVLTMPQRCKMGKGTKPLLVEAFRDELPSVVYNRPKQGFSLPMDSWIRGPLASFTYEGTQAAIKLFGHSTPADSWRAFQDGKLHWTRIWSWCILGHWASRYMAVEQV
ncbi:MAG: asparagine synthase (glutamine-hydrolyzing) [Cytophagales bacterium]|nr:MAG: asparagine synthase (glutamine-hydrolyzing) [Cytophagales bacterium]